MLQLIFLTFLYVANTTGNESIQRIDDAEQESENQEHRLTVTYCNNLRVPWVPKQFQKYLRADVRLALCDDEDYPGPKARLTRCSDNIHVIPFHECREIDLSGANWAEAALIPHGTQDWNHTLEWWYCGISNNQLRNVFSDGDIVSLPRPRLTFDESEFCDSRQSTTSTTTTTTFTTDTTTITTTSPGPSPVVPVIGGGAMICVVCCVAGMFRRNIARVLCPQRQQRQPELQEELRRNPVRTESQRQQRQQDQTSASSSANIGHTALSMNVLAITHGVCPTHGRNPCPICHQRRRQRASSWRWGRTSASPSANIGQLPEEISRRISSYTNDA